MIKIQVSENIPSARGKAGHGSFESRWRYSFNSQVDSGHRNFGVLRAFNDDTLSPGAALPLHSRRDTEMVTYCVKGEFRHFDDKGHDGILKKGWVQHTSVGSGMRHAEINNLQEQPVRFIRIGFSPNRKGGKPHYEQKPVQRRQRTNKLLPLVSNEHLGSLKINSDAEVFSSFLQKGKHLRHQIPRGRGLFVYILEGGPARINGRRLPPLSPAEIYGEDSADIAVDRDSELMLIDVRLAR